MVLIGGWWLRLVSLGIEAVGRERYGRRGQGRRDGVVRGWGGGTAVEWSLCGLGHLVQAPALCVRGCLGEASGPRVATGVPRIAEVMIWREMPVLFIQKVLQL